METSNLKIKKSGKGNYKKIILKKLFLYLTLSFAITFSGCKKENPILPKNSLNVNDRIEAMDYQKTLSIISQILSAKCKLQDLSPSDFFEITSSSPTGGIKMDSDIQKVTPNGDTIKVIIDYDEIQGKINSRSLIYCFSGTADDNGIVKEGRITYRINNDKLFLDSGMTCDVIIQNLRINGNKVNGTINIENKGDASYSVSTHHFKVLIAGKTVEIVEGLFTKIDGSCRYELTGYASVISSIGKPFNAIITDKVIVDTDCRWRLVAGKIELEIENQSKKSIDFGNGDCDPFAIITIDNLKIPTIL